MRHCFLSLSLFLLLGCASTSSTPSAASCEQLRQEMRGLAQIISTKQKWFLETHKKYSSSLESIVGELKGHLRYNALFLRTNPDDESTWSFYTPGTAPRRHIHNLFLSVQREDNELLKPRKVWIDPDFRTAEFNESELKKLCPDCTAGSEKFKVAIVLKFPKGKIDLWTLTETGALVNEVDGCR